jgi:hypothetical protein
MRNRSSRSPPPPRSPAVGRVGDPAENAGALHYPSDQVRGICLKFCKAASRAFIMVARRSISSSSVIANGGCPATSPRPAYTLFSP